MFYVKYIHQWKSFVHCLFFKIKLFISEHIGKHGGRYQDVCRRLISAHLYLLRDTYLNREAVVS